MRSSTISCVRCTIWTSWAAPVSHEPKRPARARPALHRGVSLPLLPVAARKRRGAPERPARAPQRRSRGTTHLAEELGRGLAEDLGVVGPFARGQRLDQSVALGALSQE